LKTVRCTNLDGGRFLFAKTTDCQRQCARMADVYPISIDVVIVFILQDALSRPPGMVDFKPGTAITGCRTVVGINEHHTCCVVAAKRLSSHQIAILVAHQKALAHGWRSSLGCSMAPCIASQGSISAQFCSPGHLLITTHAAPSPQLHTLYPKPFGYNYA
jgi:hypothetical protein